MFWKLVPIIISPTMVTYIKYTREFSDGVFWAMMIAAVVVIFAIFWFKIFRDGKF